MTSTNHTIPARVRQCLAGATFALSLAMASAAVASAEPSWDIDEYDKCMAAQGTAVFECCVLSGGVVVDDPNMTLGVNCVAPPAEPVDRSPGDTGPATGKPGLTPPQAGQPGLAPVTTTPPPPAVAPAPAPGLAPR